MSNLVYYGKELYSLSLYHHGILGMKWGIRRFQNKDGSLTLEGYKRYANKNLSKAKTVNMDKWGKDEDHNTLYITGYSGSGKSTVAIGLRKNNDKIISLDGYSEPDINKETVAMRNKEFNKHLDKVSPNWRKMSNATENGKNGTIKQFSPEYWTEVDKFRDAIDSFSKFEFKRGNRVIVEGIQIADGWLSNDKSFYDGKSSIILGTGKFSSMKRMMERDNVKFRTFNDAKERVKHYLQYSKVLDEYSNAVNAKRGENWVKEYLKRNT